MKKLAIGILALGVFGLLACTSAKKIEDIIAREAEMAPAPSEVSEEAAAVGTPKTSLMKARDKEARPAVAPRPGRYITGAPPRSPGVKAGAADDNRQFNHYLDYLERFSRLNVLKLDISNRIVFKAVDEEGKSIPNCLLSFKDPKGKKLAERRTYADGRAMFFPSESKKFSAQGTKVRATCYRKTIERVIDPNGEKTVELKFPGKRKDYKNVSLDIAFLLDTTGSMGDEITRLKQTIEVIHFQISQLSSAPDVRFGMVLYRDRGDEYVTKVIPFTSNMEEFKSELAQVWASGGGDTPEDLQSGLNDTMSKLDWRKSGIRLMFIIADAPPHLDYGQQYTYLNAMKDGANRAIKFVSIGASGLPNDGEYVFRQLAQYTMGIFVFLTYGETGEAEGGGGTVAVSHHTGSNWQAENLDTIVVRMVKTELSYLTDQPVTEGEDYFETTPSEDADRDMVLDDLFSQAVKQLLDYSIVRIEEKTPTVLMPVSVKDEDLKAVSELLEDRLAIVMFKSPQFQMLERENIQQLLSEMSLQITDIFDDEKTIEVGKLAGAKLAVISKLYRGKKKLELFLKLVRIETGEIISVTLAKIDDRLVK
ncbi:MAG: VWA domain-containing protein [Deltaproteobacteria bacterium]|nr:MAG: VWA domain-containing protein [Deltaproteobacteria bacterium]